VTQVSPHPLGLRATSCGFSRHIAHNTWLYQQCTRSIQTRFAHIFYGQSLAVKCNYLRKAKLISYSHQAIKPNKIN
jgi:hypothetical protein